MEQKTPFPQSKKTTKPDGTQIYIWDGKIHNWDGPALINPDGTKEWYLYGIKYTEKQFKDRLKSREGLPWYKGGSAKARF